LLRSNVLIPIVKSGDNVTSHSTHLGNPGSDEAVCDTALRAVKDLIDSDTEVVIGHSLDSVVAYQAMQQVGHSLPSLITIGSPLGLETIVYPKLRPQPPSSPPVVQRWVNVADSDDFIAAGPDLRANVLA
jgi:hypothetical protein